MNLKEFKEKNGLTLDQLAEMIGIDRSTVWQIVGGRKPSLTSAMKIQKATGISFEDMLKKE